MHRVMGRGEGRERPESLPLPHPILHCDTGNSLNIWNRCPLSIKGNTQALLSYHYTYLYFVVMLTKYLSCSLALGNVT